LLAATAVLGLPLPYDTPATDAKKQPAVADSATDQKEIPIEERLPPGFKTKKRGEIVLYCMKDSTVGTRFKTEKCYDEAQMRDYLAAQQENKRDIERVRSTCSTGTEYCVRQGDQWLPASGWDL
jgi:hypothetical protein